MVRGRRNPADGVRRKAAMEFLNFDLFKWVILPLLIFTARIFDVSLQTMRIIFISKGRRLLAPLLGFFEVIIWLVAISQIMQNLTNPFYYLAYGAGFAMGTYVGMRIEEKLAVGNVLLRVITPNNADALVERLREEKHGVTCIDGEGKSGKVKIIFLVLDRVNLPRVIETVRQCRPEAFYSVEDIRAVGRGYFRVKTRDRLWSQRK